MNKNEGNKIKCPECKSAPCAFFEIAQAGVRFDLIDGKFTQLQDCNGHAKTGFGSYDVESYLEYVEPVGKVQAECGNCSHEWILRNHRMIGGLIEIQGVVAVRDADAFGRQEEPYKGACMQDINAKVSGKLSSYDVRLVNGTMYVRDELILTNVITMGDDCFEADALNVISGFVKDYDEYHWTEIQIADNSWTLEEVQALGFETIEELIKHQQSLKS